MDQMDQDEPRNLQSRLKNCLQTILELEPELERLELGHVLLKEYNVLRSFVEKIDQVALQEQDVARIEHATANFLEELRMPLELAEENGSKRHTIH